MRRPATRCGFPTNRHSPPNRRADSGLRQTRSAGLTSRRTRTPQEAREPVSCSSPMFRTLPGCPQEPARQRMPIEDVRRGSTPHPGVPLLTAFERVDRAGAARAAPSPAGFVVAGRPRGRNFARPFSTSRNGRTRTRRSVCNQLPGIASLRPPRRVHATRGTPLPLQTWSSAMKRWSGIRRPTTRARRRISALDSS